MNKRLIVICLSLATGALLAVLLLAANSALVSAAPPRPTIPDAPTAHTDAVTLSWNSGWVAIAPGSAITLYHNLGGDPATYHVEMWFYDLNDGYGINTIAYGGAEDMGEWLGAAWQHLTANSITVIRHADDINADRIRVRIWVPDPPPDYCTAWGNINAGQAITIVHSLGGDEDDLTTDLMFRSTANGINRRAYGGLEYGGGANFVGAYWYDLNNSTVSIYRNAQDAFAQQVRMCVAVADPPSYDSGWVNMPAGVMAFDHNLGGSPLFYRVRVDAWNPEQHINHYFAGGEVVNATPVGVYWSNLTNDSLTVVNLGGQTQVRVRIWATFPTYLPVIMRH